MTQYQGRYVEADESWQVTTAGEKEDYEYLQKFFNDRKGALEEFYCVLSGVQYTVRFASKISMTELRELQKIVGYKCSFTLKKVKK